MAYYMKGKEKRILKAYAEKLPIYPLFDKDEEPIWEMVEVRGEILLKETNQRTVPDFRYVKRFHNGKAYWNKIQKPDLEIEPHKYYSRQQQQVSDPYIYLSKRIEKDGPSILQIATDDYLAEYARAAKITLKRTTTGNDGQDKPNDAEPGTDIQAEQAV